jgi:hypothetical protein
VSSQEIVGCALCGWVTRPETFEGADPVCLECGGPLRAMDLGSARRLVRARRRADERRRAAQNAAELGLDRADPGTENEGEGRRPAHS